MHFTDELLARINLSTSSVRGMGSKRVKGLEMEILDRNELYLKLLRGSAVGGAQD